VVRGGSWNNNQNNARAAYRNHNHPNNRNNNIGCRVVRRPTSYVATCHKALFQRMSGRSAGHRALSLPWEQRFQSMPAGDG